MIWRSNVDKEIASQWKYWAELVTPLATLRELVESPHFPHGKTQLLDLAVLRIRGSLELDPPAFTKGFSGKYTVKSKGPDSVPLQPPLPVGLRLGDPSELKVNLDKITCFGWFTPLGEDTLHAPDAKVVESLSRGLIISQVLLHTVAAAGRPSTTAVASSASTPIGPPDAPGLTVSARSPPDTRPTCGW